MKVDLKRGEGLEVIGKHCCEAMKLELRVGNIVSDTITLAVPFHEDNDSSKEIEAWMTIYYCPWCGEKIDIINSAMYKTEQTLYELCYEHWLKWNPI
jgi:hypothetical protein